MARPQGSAQHPGDELDEEAAVRALTDLALDCVRGHADAAQLAREVRRHLLKKHDDVLYDAVEEARGLVEGTSTLLRDTVEEAAATVLIRKEGAPDREINAFAIPLFVRSTGGLREGEAFSDDEAFDALLESFARDGLESPDAKVVLIRHWYDLDAFDRITYSTLHEIVREVAGGMDVRKVRPMPVLEQSMAGGVASDFAPDDSAMELRFLLGFSLKRADDPFYAVPKDAARAEAYFERRMDRYREWTVARAPLVSRLLAAPGRDIEISFLYQDLFFGAKEQAVDELFILQVMADASVAMEGAGVAPLQARATVAQDGAAAHALLLGPDGTQLAAFDKPVDGKEEGEAAAASLRDAFASLGVPVQ